jgi:hypothetical protein
VANPIVASTASSAAAFFDSLQAEQSQAFSGNQAALNALQSAWSPILAGGSIPAGYSPGLDAMLQSQIRSQGAQATANATDAAALQQKQASGGANVLPTGANAAVNAEIQATGQQKTAAGLQAEKTADYQQGVANLEGATSAELGIASGENETGLASAATGAGGLGLNAAEAQWQENQTSSPAAILGDIGQGVSDAAGLAGMASGFIPTGGGSGGSGFGAPGTNVGDSYIGAGEDAGYGYNG